MLMDSTLSVPLGRGSAGSQHGPPGPSGEQRQGDRAPGCFAVSLCVSLCVCVCACSKPPTEGKQMSILISKFTYPTKNNKKKEKSGALLWHLGEGQNETGG